MRSHFFSNRSNRFGIFHETLHVPRYYRHSFGSVNVLRQNDTNDNQINVIVQIMLNELDILAKV